MKGKAQHQLLVSVTRLTQSELPFVPHWLGNWRSQMIPQICGPRSSARISGHQTRTNMMHTYVPSRRL